MGVTYGVNVRLKGPIVEGRGKIATARMTSTALRDVADYAKYEVSMDLTKVLRHPTGYYESRIVKELRGPGVYSINDSGVIYGPWLEGVSFRNQTSSFKGYATFRRARNRVSRKATAIGEAAIARGVGLLG
jgi:hypothetical protein